MSHDAAPVCNTPVRVAIGPELPEFGSWMWLGNDLATSLPNQWQTTTFRETVPDSDIVIFIKFLPSEEVLRAVAARSAVIFCPVDVYGSAAAIDCDAGRLRHCDRIVAHAQRLVRYFTAYAPTTYLDHHIKYVLPTRTEPVESGPVLWVGERSNLGPLVDWMNAGVLPHPWPLVVLTNFEGVAPTPVDLGFRGNLVVNVERWSPESHLEWLRRCRAALDIKGNDFRARHKPPAKALDYLASGIPLAINADSSSVEHLRNMGFEVATPDDTAMWFSHEYAMETARFGRTVNDLLSLRRINIRWQWLLRDVFAANRHARVA